MITKTEGEQPVHRRHLLATSYWAESPDPLSPITANLSVSGRFGSVSVGAATGRMPTVRRMTTVTRILDTFSPQKDTSGLRWRSPCLTPSRRLCQRRDEQPECHARNVRETSLELMVACGVFGTTGRNSAGPSVGHVGGLRNAKIFPRSSVVPAGSALASESREHQRVSSNPFIGRADSGNWPERRPLVQGLVSRRRINGLPASGLNDGHERARRGQMHHRRGRGGRVCSRGQSAHGSRPRRPERSRRSSIPIAQAPTDLRLRRDSGRLQLLEQRPLVVALRI